MPDPKPYVGGSPEWFPRPESENDKWYWTKDEFKNPRHRDPAFYADLLARGPENDMEEEVLRILKSGDLKYFDTDVVRRTLQNKGIVEKYPELQAFVRHEQDLKGTAEGPPRDDVFNQMLNYMVLRKGQ